jgi:antitoxin HicB
MLGYRKLAPDDNGTVLVTCPALPEVTTFGEDEADALRRALQCLMSRATWPEAE